MRFDAGVRIKLLAVSAVVPLAIFGAGCADNSGASSVRPETVAPASSEQTDSPGRTATENAPTPKNLATTTSTPEHTVTTEPSPGSESGTDSNPAGQPDQVAVAEPKTQPQPKSKTPAKTPNTSNRLRDISFDDIKFEMEKGGTFKRSMVTPEIEALKGQRVRIRGYMLPSFQQSGLTQFVLMRDNMECCFGPGAMIYDSIIVEMKPGATADYSIKPVTVDGIFEIEEYRVDGELFGLYRMQGERAQ